MKKYLKKVFGEYSDEDHKIGMKLNFIIILPFEAICHIVMKI
jgi:hypothetical protein